MKDHLTGKESEVILPQMAIEMLYELTKGDAIITTGVGQHQMWAGQYYKYKFPRQFLTSAGLGAMGYGYPAALGAKVACHDKQVIDIDGDGSFLMNVQELATAHIEKIAAKALILNNQHLGMVVQWEDKFYEGNRGHTFLGDPENRQQIYPDYVTMAKSFNVPAERVMFHKDLRAAMQRMLDSEGTLPARCHHALHRTRAALHSRRAHGRGYDLLKTARVSFKAAVSTAAFLFTRAHLNAAHVALATAALRLFTTTLCVPCRHEIHFTHRAGSFSRRVRLASCA